MGKKLIRKLLFFIAMLMISAALISSIFRGLTPLAKRYKPLIEQKLSAAIHHQVEVGDIKTGWYWLEPVIQLQNIRVTDKHYDAPQIAKIYVGINLLSSLLQWRIQPGALYIEGVHLALHEKAKQWHIRGVKPQAGSKNASPVLKDFLSVWLALHNKIIFENISVSLHFSNGTLMPFKNVNLKIINNGGHYLLKGFAKLKQTQWTRIKLLAELYYDPYLPEQARGEIYLFAKQLMPAQWQAFLPEKYRQFEGGQGNIHLWIDIAKARIADVYTVLNFKHLALKTPLDDKHQLLQQFKTSLSWNKTDQGWKLIADKLRMRVDGVSWPRNHFSLEYDKQKDLYQLSVKTLLLNSLIKAVGSWSEVVNPLNKRDIHGLLKDTLIHFQQGKLQYLLTAFRQVGWHSNTHLPSANHLSGVVFWQEDRGRIALDSENSLVAMAGYPAQTFSEINGNIHWQRIHSGLRFIVDQLFFNNPDFSLNLHGAFDGVSLKGMDDMRFKIDFSARDFEQWKAYLPKAQLKPKLYHWLKNGVEQIGEIAGQITVEGKPENFPFDQGEGLFKINTQIQNVALKATPKWPLFSHINGFLRYQNRLLEAEILHADLMEVPVRQMHLAVNNLGLDKENLFIHSKIQADGQKMLDFVLATPLEKKLARLRMFQMQGPLDLDFKLQVGLHHPDLPVLAEGNLLFDENNLEIKHHYGLINLKDIRGSLQFNELGIEQSQLKAEAFSYPFDMQIQTIKASKPYTAINIHSNMDIQDLKQQYPLKLFDFMHGRLSSSTVIKITEDTSDLDQMQIRSQLEDLVIDLPPPFGKQLNKLMPLQVDIGFNPEKAVRLRLSYNHVFSAFLYFNHKDKGLAFQSGELRIGSARASEKIHQGLRLLGTMPSFNLAQWQAVFSKASAGEGNSIFSYLNFVDLKFKKLNLLQHSYQNFILTAKKSLQDTWSIALRERAFKADLNFNPKQNILSGHMNRFQLTTAKAGSGVEKRFADVAKPADIPDLNLQIDQLLWNDKVLGQFNFKTHYQDETFHLERSLLKNPYYQVEASGDWIKNQQENQSKLNLNLKIADLGRSIHPYVDESVLEEGHGDIQFQGHWPGALIDFNLKKVQGDLAIDIRNGRITHLSKETEDKMALGKLLSILSLQTIPRRLVLDFSDLSEKGYSFDRFKGDFALKNGELSTQNSSIDGPVAYASIRGKLNLLDKYYDLQLKISPHITASLPIVATIAGGPIAGIATWIASKIINKGMQQINAYTYKITGPWDKPLVQQLNIVKKAGHE